MVPLVPAGTEGLAGLELGGVPLATMLSSVTGLPAYFVRKQPKKYGRYPGFGDFAHSLKHEKRSLGGKKRRMIGMRICNSKPKRDGACGR